MLLFFLAVGYCAMNSSIRHYGCGGGISSTQIRDTEFQPVYASADPIPLQLPTQNPTRTTPFWTFSHAPSICRTRCKSFLAPFPCIMYTTPSIPAGAEHSAPLKVKYHRLQQPWQLQIRRGPLQKTRRAVLADFLKKRQSWRKNIYV